MGKNPLLATNLSQNQKKRLLEQFSVHVPCFASKYLSIMQSYYKSWKMANLSKFKPEKT